MKGEKTGEEVNVERKEVQLEGEEGVGRGCGTRAGLRCQEAILWGQVESSGRKLT